MDLHKSIGLIDVISLQKELKTFLEWVQNSTFRALISHMIQKIHGFIWMLSQEVPSIHCFQKLLHGWGHATIEVVYKHPSIETMMWTSTDGLPEPHPALIESLIVMGSKCVDLPLQIVGLVSTKEFF